MPAENRSDALPLWTFEVHAQLGQRPTARLAPKDRAMPTHRSLRVYAQDPSLRREDGALYTVDVPYEALSPGPAGAVLVVDDVDNDSQEVHAPVDLDASALLLQGGLAPSSTNRQFMQQIVYAVGMETYMAFVRALGRDPGFGPLGGKAAKDGKLRLQPAARLEANAYYDRESGSLKFGYARAEAFAKGPSQPGALVYTALSREIIAHEMSHALLDGLRPNFMRPTHRDVAALHEGFSDLVAVFLRFAQRDVVERAIEKQQGQLRDDLLVSIGREFGFTQVTGTNPLRTAITTPGPGQLLADEQLYDHHSEEHDLGAVLLSAVFEAFCEVYERDTRSIRNSICLYQGRLPLEGVRWLAARASKLAHRFLNIVIRAIDYCPPVHCSFGEYLRALITADHDLVGSDGAAYRETIISSFRRFGITVPEVPTLSEESLLWQQPKGGPIQVPQLQFRNLGLAFTDGYCDWPRDGGIALRSAAQALGRTISQSSHGREFGLAPTGGPFAIPRILSLRTLRRVSLRQEVSFDLVAEVVQKCQVREGWFLGGATVVISSEGEIRYAITKHVDSRRRLAEQRKWMRTQSEAVRDAAWHEHSVVSARLQRRLHLCRREA